MMSKGRPRPIEIIIITRLENLSSGGVPYPTIKVLCKQNKRRVGLVRRTRAVFHVSVISSDSSYHVE